MAQPFSLYLKWMRKDESDYVQEDRIDIYDGIECKPIIESLEYVTLRAKVRAKTQDGKREQT